MFGETSNAIMAEIKVVEYFISKLIIEMFCICENTIKLRNNDNFFELLQKKCANACYIKKNV